MSEVMLSQSSPLKTYPSHVLFQFIFVSFLRTHEAMKSLCDLRNRLEISQEISDRENQKKKLLLTLANCIGTTSPSHNHSSLAPSLGPLTNLKNDCALLLKNYSTQIPEAFQMNKQATLSWLYGIELYNLASQLSQESPLMGHKDFLRFLKVEAQLTMQLKKMGNAMVKGFMRFKTNENVLLCLMQHQHQLDAVYEKAFTLDILKKMGLNTENVRHFIIEAYNKRGFKDLMSTLIPKAFSMSTL